MNQKVIVLSVSQYMIVNDRTGEVENEGCTVRYIMTDDTKPRSDNRGKGYKPAKATIPYNDYHKYETVPGLYEAVFALDVDSAGNTKLKASDFNFLHEISVVKSK